MAGEVLLQLETPLRAECQIVAGAPTDEAVRVTVATAAAAVAGTCADARSLYDELALLLNQLPGTSTRSIHRGSSGCSALTSTPRDHNVLVVVEDAAVDIGQSVVSGFRKCPSHIILPLAERKSRLVPSSLIAQNIMLQYAPGAIEALAPDVLVSARVGTDAFRVFISYMHDDCAAAAQQVFHQLAEARFAVFLDRFCGAPGQNFVARINSELFDKSCVVVLETPNIANSHWVQAEVAIARTHRLGLLAVDLPGWTHAFPIATRLDCTSANHGSQLGPSGTLADADLKRIVEFVRANIATQGARRRRWQRRSLRVAISRTGITDGGQSLLGRRVSGANATNYNLGLTARPPGAQSFKGAQQATTPPERAILFGPLSHQMMGDAVLTRWLGSVSRVRAVDEARMIPALYLAKRGRL